MEDIAYQMDGCLQGKSVYTVTPQHIYRSLSIELEVLIETQVI